ncbi:MAG: thiamine/thiamine pyrophosphate ABC transporter permease ThiP [Planktomarina sp.]|nr:thiamine/thiamine pyrophosphate ABC transporter permease ThiP [Planktomarina sp.]MDT2033484.1 thiamine/thiamine pyrophosphate ABC transporter permease ThiP [Planktomarina sp.]MDT2039469.1 thiamine/thiamine pyrophosphate ABC transporter permease ThiP [Planktomarina sp.]MDT2049400.1 thiamine/thiamine pyrophosphate ABC transporter permease ThiP [Planktomarina sp.]
MADSVIAITLRLTLGGAVIFALLIFSFGTAAAVASKGDGFGTLVLADFSAIWFTIWQALVSAILSVCLAIPVSRALWRQNFFGRRALIILLGAPFILPVLVGVLGLLAVFGRSGWISELLLFFGLGRLSIYGAFGVILAHVFFNLPLATRLLLQGWSAVPGEKFRVADSLGSNSWAKFLLIEWPMLRGAIPGAFVLIFLLCLTSFTVALAVGGGPRGTTIELAIYQAFRFEFDLGKAASLATVQFGICVTVAFLACLVPLPKLGGIGLDRLVQQFDAWKHRKLDLIWISGAAAFLILPLAAILFRGLGNILTLPGQVLAASITSLLIALISTAVCICLALVLSLSLAHSRLNTQKIAEGISILGLSTSPLVVGTGLFLMIFPFVHPASLAIPVTAFVNAMMAMPFVLRVLMPAVREIYNDYLHLRLSLNMGRGVWLMRIVFPRLRRPIGFSVGLVAALSMGDFGVIALFSDPELQTLPLMLYRLMGAYRMDQAAAVAVVLVAQSLFLFWIFDQGGRRHSVS